MIGSPDPRLPTVWFYDGKTYGVSCDCGYLVTGFPVRLLAERELSRHVRAEHRRNPQPAGES